MCMIMGEDYASKLFDLDLRRWIDIPSLQTDKFDESFEIAETYRNKFQDLINEYHRRAKSKHGLPLYPVQRSDGK